MRERIALLISCPHCEQGTLKAIAWLNKNEETRCDYCGRIIDIRDRDNTFWIAELTVLADRLDKRNWRPLSQRR
jgi:hypothetical protein